MRVCPSGMLKYYLANFVLLVNLDYTWIRMVRLEVHSGVPKEQFKFIEPPVEAK